jgi:hypothetical protein
MGTVLSTLKDARSRSKLLSLLLLWRGSYKTFGDRSPAAKLRILALTSLLLAPASFWQGLREKTGLSEPQHKALTLTALQSENTMPEFTSCYGLASSIINAACNLPRFVLASSISVVSASCPTARHIVLIGRAARAGNRFSTRFSASRPSASRRRTTSSCSR